jgi:hemolysin activation/secretion protein
MTIGPMTKGSVVKTRMSSHDQSNRIGKAAWVVAACAVLLAFWIICQSAAVCFSQDAPSVVLRDVVIDSSEILSEEEIQSVTHGYIGKSVTVADLNQMVEEINELYRAKNVVTAKAILPAQTVENGVVRVRLVEGRIGKVLVEGNTNAVASYYTDRIRLVTGELVRLDDITEAVAYFNRVDEDQVAVQLMPGEEFGTTDCLLVVHEVPDQLLTFVDNSGRDDTGLIRTGFTAVLRHLHGLGDHLTVSVAWADETFACSASYRIPTGVRGAKLTIGADKSDVNVMTPGFGALGVQGHSSGSHIEWSWPMIAEPEFRLWGSIRLQWKNSSSSLAGTTLLSSTARTARIALSAQWVEQGFSWQGGCEYVYGVVVPGFGGSESSTFNKLGASLTWQKALSDRYFLTLRGALQIAPEQLPSSDVFSVGGASSVRGYTEGELIGDQGYFGSIEFSTPIAEKHRGSVFLDYAGAFAASGGAMPGLATQIASAGIGLSGTLAGVEYRLTYGVWEGRSPGFHASLQKWF